MTIIRGYNACLGLLVVLTLTVAGCSTESRQGAAQGAATGAAVGAVGGVVTALVFGGDVGNAAARGAVWGGSTGAVSGGIQGAEVADKKRAAEEKKKADELAKLRKDIGDDAYLGLEALVDCKLPVSLAYAETAKGNNKANYALAGYWLEVLTITEQGRRDDALAILPQLVKKDKKLSSTDSARGLMDEAIVELGDIRQEVGLSRSCG
ncbi:MAG: hypothetical protein V7754_05075 [Halioglobus sp.]